MKTTCLVYCFMIWICLIVSSWLNSLTNFYMSTIAIICVLLTALYQEAYNVDFNSVAQSCLTLCNPMDCSMPGFPVHHWLPELVQTHVTWVGDAIQPFHPLSSLLFPSSVFPSIKSIGVSASTSVLTMNTQDWSPLGWTGCTSLQSKGLSRVFSNTTV